MPDHTHDYLIIGQGLAGSLLAWHLLRAGKRVLVLDDAHATSSSKVAAGLINPLAGMRFNCAPHTAAWLASAHAFYDQLGALFGQQYFHSIDMQRVFRSPEQRRFYDRQVQRGTSQGYLAEQLSPAQFDHGVQAPHGGFAQKQTGYLDMARILVDLRTWLGDRGAYREMAIDPALIEVNQHGVRLHRIWARYAVFCEGYRMRDNPWFNALPLQPDKGEFLRLHSERALCQHIVNGAHWIIPLADGSYRFGATHEHKQIDTEPTQAALEQLLLGLGKLLQRSDDIEIAEHRAGVRPATSDRQPFVGRHPRHAALSIFNGFGARGALSIPWHAERFSAYLLHGSPIPAEADIARYRDRL